MTKQPYSHQLDTILGMLNQGHNSIQLESHVLPMWSIIAAFLIGFTGVIVTQITSLILNGHTEYHGFQNKCINRCSLSALAAVVHA